MIGAFTLDMNIPTFNVPSSDRRTAASALRRRGWTIQNAVLAAALASVSYRSGEAFEIDPKPQDIADETSVIDGAGIFLYPLLIFIFQV